MTIKYAVFPGNVQSKVDGDKHFISAYRLMSLYGVDRRECVIVDNHRKLMQYRSSFPKLIALHPQFEGNYNLPEWSASCEERKTMTTRKEAKIAVETARDRELGSGNAVFKIEEGGCMFTLHWMRSSWGGPDYLSESFHFTPPAKKYSSGTIGYVWNDGVKKAGVIRLLIECHEGSHPYECATADGFGCTVCWKHFEPVEQTSGLAEKAEKS